MDINLNDNPEQGDDIEMIDISEEDTIFEVQSTPKEWRATK